jgi:hypothetical protein
MFVILFDIKGMTIAEYVPSSQTMNQMYYRALTETERKNSKKGTGVIVELFYSAP